MRILALETSEYVSSVALACDGVLQGEQTFPSRMNLCETLTQRLQSLLSTPLACEAGLEAIAVSLGPGSFTGLKVGVATAKALAHACGVPLLGVGTQEILAAAPEAAGHGRLWVVQRARRGHLYAGWWERDEEGAGSLLPPSVVAAEDLPALLADRPGPLLGPAADMAAEALVGSPQARQIISLGPSAGVLAGLAEGRLCDCDPQAAFNLRPIYILPSQAERTANLDVTTGSRAPGRPLRLRQAHLPDLSQIMATERASFSSPWPERSMRDELAREDGRLFLVADTEGAVVGYIGVWLYSGEAHICTLAVAPHYRRCGIAEILMITAIRKAMDLGTDYVILEYRITNDAARSLYEKLGFRYVHTRKGYYPDTDEDAVVVAMADLATEERREHLASLLSAWRQRYNYELSVEL